MNLQEFQAIFQDNRATADSFTCPRCGLTSNNPNDAANLYCSRCHAFMRDIAPLLAYMMSTEESLLSKRLRVSYVRQLPHGRFLLVEPLLWGSAYLKLCSDTDPHGGADDVWQYDYFACAIAAAACWNPEQRPEPFGFYRHPASGRRRKDGNPAQEFVLL